MTIRTPPTKPCSKARPAMPSSGPGTIPSAIPTIPCFRTEPKRTKTQIHTTGSSHSLWIVCLFVPLFVSTVILPLVVYPLSFKANAAHKVNFSTSAFVLPACASAVDAAPLLLPASHERVGSDTSGSMLRETQQPRTTISKGTPATTQAHTRPPPSRDQGHT